MQGFKKGDLLRGLATSFPDTPLFRVLEDSDHEYVHIQWLNRSCEGGTYYKWRFELVNMSLSEEDVL